MNVGDGRETVHVEVLAVEGCPHAEAAFHLAHDVAGRLGPGISVDRVDVESSEREAEPGLLGAPSIRVNGWDVDETSRHDNTR
jgi:hypothetical protein